MFSELKYQIAHKIIEIIISISRVCAEQWLTISLFFCQLYWAIKILQAIEKPVPKAIIKNITGQLTETAATASFEILQTQ